MSACSNNSKHEFFPSLANLSPGLPGLHGDLENELSREPGALSFYVIPEGIQMIRQGATDEERYIIQSVVLQSKGVHISSQGRQIQVQLPNSNLEAWCDQMVLVGPSNRALLTGNVRLKYRRKGRETHIIENRTTINILTGYPEMDPPRTREQQYWYDYRESGDND